MVKKILSLLTAAATASTFTQVLPAHAESALPLYPYTLFAASDAAGAITVNSGNVCINGNIATNGTIVTTAQNFNVNGQSAEHAAAEMLYINSRLSQTFFESASTETVAGDCVIEDVNIYINDPLDVTGDISLNGNIELNAGLRSLEDITLSGNVENTYNTVVYSQTGDISIESVNVNFSGLIYAPYGDIVIDSQNLNLNNAIIIGQTITITCPNFNANYNPYMGGVIGTESSDSTDPDTITDGALFSVGDYDPATQSIVIDWFTESTPSSFEILVSDDNTEYTSVAVVTEGTEYSYPIGDGFDTKYFKVSYTDKDGNVTESIPFYAVRTEDGYEVKLLDSDGDELPDVYESIMGTDPMNADTDNDGLTDYQEILLTGTDPAKYDSVAEGVSDSDADSDGDDISNADEIALGTDPLSTDSDDDGLSDYDEVNVHHTDPLNSDTDNDGITDGSEWKIGLDPNNVQTHGIPDGEYSIDQTVASDSAVFSLINTEDSPYDLSVRITTAGCAEDEMTVTESGYSHAIENEMITGQSVDISLPEERTPETIQIRFNIREDQIANKLNKYTDCDELCGIKRFNVFHFYDDVNMLLPVETSFDIENNVVYTDTTEQGTYCLVDMEYWMDSLGIEPATTANSQSANGFMTMQGASINADDTGIQKQRFDGRDYALIEPGIITWHDAKAACEDMGGHLCTITSPAEQAFIESLISTGTAENYWLGATDEVTEGDWKWITDEPWNYEHWGENQPSNTVRYNRYGEDYLGLTTVDSKWAAVNDWNDYRPDDDIVNGYICEWENEDIEGTKYTILVASNWKTITLNAPLSPDNYIDTDTDELTDWEEVKSEYLTLLPDGSYELPTINDLLPQLNFSSILGRFSLSIYSPALNTAWSRSILPVNSDPIMMDSDFDGLNDFIESYAGLNPLENESYSKITLKVNRFIEWKELAKDYSWNYIHNLVQSDIILKDAEITKEYWLKSSLGINIKRIDLYSRRTNEIWEVKPASYQYSPNREKGLAQLHGYMILANQPQNDLNVHIGGERIIPGHIEVADYSIDYINNMNGLITYNFQRKKKEPVPVSESEKDTANKLVPAANMTQQVAIDWLCSIALLCNNDPTVFGEAVINGMKDMVLPPYIYDNAEEIIATGVEIGGVLGVIYIIYALAPLFAIAV